MAGELRKRSALQSKPGAPMATAAEAAERGAEDRDRGYEERARLEEERERSEQRAGEDAFAAAAGDEGRVVEVTWGEELFQPVRFNSLRVGPFTASTLVRKGESVAAATLRLHREIAKAAQVVFEEQSRAYLRNLAGLTAQASKVEIPG